MNWIVQIMDESESIHKKPGEIGQAFIQFYQCLFSTSRPEGIEDCVSSVEARVTEDMNEQLTKGFSVEAFYCFYHKCNHSKRLDPMVLQHVSTRSIGQSWELT